ncbi:UNVERIFIED_CONTAM: flippase, partial [Cronobacter sakazakii]
VGYGLTMPYLILVNYLFYYAKNRVISLVTFSSSLLYIIALYGFSQLKLEWIPFALILSNLFM